MNYFQNPHPVARLPKFIYKHYAPQVFGLLMRWTDNEYNRAIDYANRHGNLNQARMLYKEWSGMRILSQMEGFRYICAQLDERSWNQLDRKTRKFIRKSFELYELLRKTST